MSFCTLQLDLAEVFLIQVNEFSVKENNHYSLSTEYIYIDADY